MSQTAPQQIFYQNGDVRPKWENDNCDCYDCHASIDGYENRTEYTANGLFRAVQEAEDDIEYALKKVKKYQAILTEARKERRNKLARLRRFEQKHNLERDDL